MLTFTVTHKHCGFTKTIKGYNVWEAFKTNGLDHNIWTVTNVKKN